MIQFSGQLVAVKLNAEKEGRALAQKYRVSGFPTVLYLDSEGIEWGRMPGFLASGPFIEYAQGALKTAREQPLLEAKLQQNPGNAALAIDLTQRFARQGNTKKALWAGNLVMKAPQSAAAGRAYVVLGGMYFDKQSPAEAQPWFARSLKVSTDPRDKAYGHLGLAMCAVARQDAKVARAELNTVLKIPNCPSGIIEKARELLQQVPP